MTTVRTVGALGAASLVLVAGACSLDKTATKDSSAHVVPAVAAPPFELLTEEGVRVIRAGQGPSGSVRLTPRTAGTDGFFFAVLRRES